jgi:DNA-binding XRE family transcriptional regulator
MVNPRLIRGDALVEEKIPSGRMIRAARALINLEQSELAATVGVDRRTINRIENEGATKNPRRLQICVRIRDALEKNFDVRFVYANSSTGEGVFMKKGK